MLEAIRREIYKESYSRVVSDGFNNVPSFPLFLAGDYIRDIFLLMLRGVR